jgi:hypothetical protein
MDAPLGGGRVDRNAPCEDAARVFEAELREAELELA